MLQKVTKDHHQPKPALVDSYTCIPGLQVTVIVVSTVTCIIGSLLISNYNADAEHNVN